MVCDARRVRGEALVLDERLQSRNTTEALELRVVADGQKELSVGRSEAVIRRDGRVAIANARRDLAGRQKHRRVIAQQRDDAVEQADVHLLTAARAVARVER